MHKLIDRYYLIILYFFTLAQLPNLAMGASSSELYDEEREQIGSSFSLSAAKFAEIEQKIKQNFVGQEVSGKDVTVILGNTGSGKSTIVNFLARVPMKVDTKGNLVPADGTGKVRVSYGGHSETKFPKLIADTEVGYLCDLPGFQDSEGAVDDVLNSAFIRSALTNARSVRALVLTTDAELDAGRAEAFKKLSTFMKMFKNRDFLRSSVYLFVNKVFSDRFADPSRTPLYYLEDKIDALRGSAAYLKDLKDARKIFFIPATEAGATQARREASLKTVTDHYAEIVDIVNGLRGMPIQDSELDMSLSLNLETQNDIKGFLEVILKQQLQDMKKGFYLNEIRQIKEGIEKDKKGGQATAAGSIVLEEKAPMFWRTFNDQVKLTSEYQLLNPICSSQFREVIRDFEATFYQEHNAAVQTLLIEEQAEAKRLAEEEARRKGEEAERANEFAALKEAEAAEAETKRQEAAKEADEKRLEAERAQADLKLSEAEKARFAEEARRAEQAREKAAADAAASRREASKALDEAKAQAAQYELKLKEIERQTAEMQKVYQERLAAMEREMQERREDAEREKEALRHEMDSLRASQAEERAALQRQMQELEEKNQRALKEAEERFERERESMRNAQQSSNERSLVGLKWVPTQYGWVLAAVYA